ncbi:MAG: NMD3-related protein, partial [Candidatus Micrarchaeia archaeon]
IKEKRKKIPNEIIIYVCKNCGSIKIRNWVKKEEREKLEEELKEKFSKFGCYKVKIENSILKVYIFDKIKFEKDVLINKKFTYCKDCSKIINKAYEGIIQIREKELSKKVEKVKKLFLENLRSIIEIEKVKNGYDIYFASTKEIFDVLKKFSLSAKVTKKLYGMKNGKRIYRTTFLIKNEKQG